MFKYLHVNDAMLWKYRRLFGARPSVQTPVRGSPERGWAQLVVSKKTHENWCLHNKSGYPAQVAAVGQGQYSFQKKSGDGPTDKQTDGHTLL